MVVQAVEDALHLHRHVEEHVYANFTNKDKIMLFLIIDQILEITRNQSILLCEVILVCKQPSTYELLSGIHKH